MSSERIPLTRNRGELREAKFAISPFGWGEISLRDFEGMISGAMILKQNVSNMEAWFAQLTGLIESALKAEIR